VVLPTAKTVLHTVLQNQQFSKEEDNIERFVSPNDNQVRSYIRYIREDVARLNYELSYLCVLIQILIAVALWHEFRQ
jgi:hypothetical protein